MKESPGIENLEQLALQSKALTTVESGIVITDHRGRIMWVNPAFSKSTGYPAEEMLGRTPRILKSGSHDQSFYRQFWDTVLSGKVWRGQFINRRRDGSLCIHAQTTTPIRWQNDGPITHFISVSEDITDSKKGEISSREIRNMDAVGQLAAGVAHHFNNLLTVIQSNSELVLEMNGELHPECRSLVERTLAASRRAAQLIRQLVGFSQNQAQEFQALDLNRVVERSLRVFGHAAKDAVEWECRYGASLPWVLGDRGMLDQMICHLLANALDAMPHGGRVTLTTERLAASPNDIGSHPAAGAGEFVCLTIRDTGCGIPPGNLARIFEPFFTTKDAGDRSGLGLALVYGIVKQHQGWTEVSSQLGRGTTFKVFLPASAKAAAFLEREPSGFSRQASGPRDILLESDANTATPSEREDAIVWVNPTFNSGDMVARPAESAKAAPLDMNELIHEVLKMLRRLLGENIEVMFEESADDLWVCADAGMVEQVAMNLCINARDAMPGGGLLTLATAMVEIGVQPELPNPDARPGRFVCLSVTDTGCGMDATVLRRIFKPFFTTKEMGKGTGLGLATVQGIVKQLGGWVEVESAVGRGSSFRVYFPAATMPLGAQAIPSHAEKIEGGSETASPGGRIHFFGLCFLNPNPNPSILGCGGRD